MKNLSLVFLILGLAILACTIPAIGSSDPLGAGSGSLLFQDDFSDPGSGWFTDRFDSGSLAEYTGGSYRLYIAEPDMLLIGQANQRLPANVVIAVDATKAGGPDDNDFGVICRMQDLYNFYSFEISSDGYASISIFADGEPRFLTGGWLRVDAINQGEASNHIQVDCIGPDLRLFANGNLVAQVSDSTFSGGGDVGLVAGTFSVSGTDIRFDNFIVTRP